MVGGGVTGKTVVRFLVVGAALACLVLEKSGLAIAETQLVRPEIPGYETPDWEGPLRQAVPRTLAAEYADLAILAFGLILASYFALRLRSRRWLILLAIGAVVWLGFLRKGCICSVGAIQNVVLSLSSPGYTVPFFVVLIFVLPLVFTLLFGRTFCAAVCPLGAFQELLALYPVRIPQWVDDVVGLLAHIYLGLAIVVTSISGAFLICQYDPVVSFFRLGGNWEIWLFSFGVILLGIFIARPYCRFLCPLGAIFRIFSPFSRWHLRIPPEPCILCRLCEGVCPYNAIRRPTEVESGRAERVSGSLIYGTLLVIGGLLVIFPLLGYGMGPTVSRLDRRVQLAERVWQEETGLVEGTTDASEVFRRSGIPIAELYRQAAEVEGKYRTGMAILGFWVASVLAGKWIQLRFPFPRTEYEPERGKCFSCGRCLRFCPLERKRLGLLDAESLDVYVAQQFGRTGDKAR
jgi:NosR/NirI family nitrous oxide reductase transcriptional regulator